MNKLSMKAVGQILLGAGFVGSVAAPAVARTCTVNRPYPVQEDIVTLSCQHFAPGSHVATTADVGVRSVAGVRRTTANLAAGGTSASASTTALDASGNTITACTATDTNKNDGTAVDKACASASKWVGTITFDE